MVEPGSKKKSWRGVKTIEEAEKLVDFGVLVRWKEMRVLRKTLPLPAQEQLMRHFAKRLCERAEDRLSSEIIVESVLTWLANNLRDSLVIAFLAQIFDESEADRGAKALVEISLTSEVTESKHNEQLYAMAVALICELGIAIHEHEARFPGDFRNSRKILDHITTYLLSVSNINNGCIRLSLIHYFGQTSQVSQDRTSFNRIMNRFGHTVLDHLFSLLFNKKSEPVALQYLVENLPHVLAADANCQKILHETFKYYMLKQPDRFALFLDTLADETLKNTASVQIRRVFLQHLGALFTVISEVHHRLLAKEMVQIMERFAFENHTEELLRYIMNEDGIRGTFKDLAKQFLGKTAAEKGNSDTLAMFKNTRRGRKPSFAREGGLGTLEQINFLGSIELDKIAS